MLDPTAPQAVDEQLRTQLACEHDDPADQLGPVSQEHPGAVQPGIRAQLPAVIRGRTPRTTGTDAVQPLLPRSAIRPV